MGAVTGLGGLVSLDFGQHERRTTCLALGGLAKVFASDSERLLALSARDLHGDRCGVLFWGSLSGWCGG
jgi:hypothetical protein